MMRADKSPTDSALFDSLLETFDLGPPVYEFGFCPVVSHDKNPAEQQTSLPVRSDGTANARSAGESGQGHASGGSLRTDRPTGTDQPTGNDQTVETDRLDDLTKLPFADASARTVICRSALEHVFEPRRAMEEMQRILKPGGILYVCVPGNRSLSSGNNFWHFTPQALQQLMQPFEASVLGWQGPDEQPHTIFAVGCKGPVDAAFLHGLNLFPQQCQRRLDARATRIGWIRKLKQAMVAWAFNPVERRRFADHYRAHFAIHMSVGKLSKGELLKSCLGESKLGTRLDLKQ